MQVPAQHGKKNTYKEEKESGKSKSKLSPCRRVFFLLGSAAVFPGCENTPLVLISRLYLIKVSVYYFSFT